VENTLDLYKKPYINIPFPVSRKEIEEAMESFFDFLDLPEEKKHHINMKISPLHRRGDLGFVHKDSKAGIYDSKDYFHYHPIIDDTYLNFIDENHEIKEFILNAHPIWDAIYQATQDVFLSLEQNNTEILEKIFDSDFPHIVLRFLKYYYKNPGEYLAKPHFDAGSFTVAVAESGPGLRIGTNPDDLESVTHEENNAIFFISSNINRILDDERLVPAWHDVVQLNESRSTESFSRWAIVAFIDGHSVESLSREETHKFNNINTPEVTIIGCQEGSYSFCMDGFDQCGLNDL
jgi:isopenicillin N synthase-like dioxygenase